MPRPRTPYFIKPSPGGAFRRGKVLTVPVLTLAIILAGCSSSKSGAVKDGDPGGAAAKALTIGTTDQVSSLDPAGSWDAGSGTIQTEVYSHLLSTSTGSTDVKSDLAASYKLTGPKEYTVTLKPGLKFANGHDLTSSDVKFSFDRQLKIADPNGPSALLYNLGPARPRSGGPSPV